MSIRITCINKDGGYHENPHVAISNLGWVEDETAKTGKTARLLRTPWTEAWDSAESPGALPMPLQFMATADATSRIHRAAEAGNAGAKELIGSPVGQIVGSMNSVRSVRDVMYSLVEEYVAVVEELHAGLAVPAKS